MSHNGMASILLCHTTGWHPLKKRGIVEIILQVPRSKTT